MGESVKAFSRTFNPGLCGFGAVVDAVVAFSVMVGLPALDFTVSGVTAGAVVPRIQSWLCREG